ncbi:MAG: DUF2079 domain-containing protein [Phycisphaerae bacterium]
MSWSHTSTLKTLIGMSGWIVGFGVFGRLRYYWVQHAVNWRPEPRYWQYLIPIAAVLILLLLMRRRTQQCAKDTTARWIQQVWTAGLAGGLLALCQFWLEPRGPWLLYAWMALLVFGAWPMAGGLRLPTISGSGCWILVITATMSMIALHISMQLELWRSLSFGYRDIGLFTRALHNAAAGRGLWVDSLDRSILGEHAFFVLWTLVPLCKLGANPFFLLITLSAFCLNAPALLVTEYVRRRMGSNFAATLAGLAWLLLPAHGCLVIAQGYGLHAIYLATPLLISGLILGGLGRWRSAAACMLLCLLIREDLALTVSAWGAIVFLAERRRVLGASVGILAMAYLILAITVIVPHYRGEPYPHIAFHFNMITETEALSPLLLINLSFLLTLILPLSGLPFRHGRWACLALPALIEVMLISNVELHNICFQYVAPIVAILFFAAIEGWYGIALRTAAAHDTPDCTQSSEISTNGRKSSLLIRSLQPGICLLSAALFGHLYLGVGPLSNNPARPSSHPILQTEIKRIVQLRSSLPINTSITASYRIAAHFLDADRLWMVGDQRLGDVIIIHEADNMDGSDPRGALTRALRSGAYQPVFANHHLVMLIRDDQPTPLARELLPDRLPEGVDPVSIDIGNGIELVGFRRTPIDEPTQSDLCIRLTLVWRCTAPIDKDYRFGLTLGPGDSRWGPFYFAHGAYPTNIWKPGQRYRDDVELWMRRKDLDRLGEINPVLLE